MPPHLHAHLSDTDHERRDGLSFALYHTCIAARVLYRSFMVASTEEVWEIFWTYHGWFALYERLTIAAVVGSQLAVICVIGPEALPSAKKRCPVRRLNEELPKWAKMRMVDPKQPLEAQVPVDPAIPIHNPHLHVTTLTFGSMLNTGSLCRLPTQKSLSLQQAKCLLKLSMLQRT